MMRFKTFWELYRDGKFDESRQWLSREEFYSDNALSALEKAEPLSSDVDEKGSENT